MAGPKNAQTRFVGNNHIQYTSLCLLFSIVMQLMMSTPIWGSRYMYFCCSILVLSLSLLDSMHVGEIPISYWYYYYGINWFIPATQKASVGMYGGCNYPHKSCLCTFWPCHPYFFLQFYSIVFYTCYNPFFLLPPGQSRQFMSLSNTIWHGLPIQNLNFIVND